MAGKRTYYHVSIYVILVAIPFLYLFPGVLPKDFRGVNPEIVNGLLTGSSIVFGFAVLPLGRKKPDFLFDIMVGIDLLFLSFCGITLFMFGIGMDNGLLSLVLAASSLNANGTTAVYRRYFERSQE